MHAFWFLYAVCFSSIAVLGILFLHTSLFVVQEIIVLCVVSILLFLRRKPAMEMKAKLVILFCTTSIIELVVLSTGGFTSPFFMLFHFFTVSLSFLFSFIAGMFFLLFAGFLLFMQSIESGTFLTTFTDDPISIILPCISLLLTIPVAYLFAYHYRLKDKLSELLLRQLEVEESILSEIEELVFVTDPIGVLVSLNEAAAKTLQLSDPQVLHRNIFDIVTFKEEEGDILSPAAIKFPTLVKEKKTVTFKRVSLVTSVASRRGILRIKSISSFEGKSVPQVAFIFFIR